METATVEITTPDGVANARLVRPDDGLHPGVLFIADAFGLRPAIDDMVGRIAAAGYVVLAPNVFYRAGRAPVDPLPEPRDPDRYAAAFRSVLPLIEQLTPARIASDGAAYLGYLGMAASPGPLAVTGYCMGGRLTWRIAAAHRDRVAALAAFHTAGLVTDAPDSPHRSAADLGPVEAYFGFADQDQGMTAAQIAELEQTLQAAGVLYRAEIYDGARHGYAVPDSPAYDEAAAQRHYRELLALLQRRRPAEFAKASRASRRSSRRPAAGQRRAGVSPPSCSTCETADLSRRTCVWSATSTTTNRSRICRTVPTMPSTVTTSSPFLMAESSSCCARRRRRRGRTMSR